MKTLFAIVLFLPAISLAASSPPFVFRANLPPMIPVVSKPVTKEKAIELVTNGGKELRVSREALVKGLKYVVAKAGGHDTGADNELSDEELIQALKDSSVVPCNFNKGNTFVYGFRREDHSKMDGYLRDSRPGEMCLSYKGARFISLACMNPIDDRKIKPVAVGPVTKPEPAPPVAVVPEPVPIIASPPPVSPSNTEWKTVAVTCLTCGQKPVTQYVAPSATWNSPVHFWGGWGWPQWGFGGLSPGGGLVYFNNPGTIPITNFSTGGLGGNWTQVFGNGSGAVPVINTNTGGLGNSWMQVPSNNQGTVFQPNLTTGGLNNNWGQVQSNNPGTVFQPNLTTGGLGNNWGQIHGGSTVINTRPPGTVIRTR